MVGAFRRAVAVIKSKKKKIITIIYIKVRELLLLMGRKINRTQ